jgi:hypothetical protein
MSKQYSRKDERGEGPINVRFGALSGHKSDIVRCPLSANNCPEQVQHWIHGRPVYSITSSAVASKVGGTVRPSMRAVW